MRNRLSRYGIKRAEVTVCLDGRMAFEDSYRHATVRLVPKSDYSGDRIEVEFQANDLRKREGRASYDAMPDSRFDVGAPYSAFYAGHVEGDFDFERPDRLDRAARVCRAIAKATAELPAPRSECDLARLVDALTALGCPTTIRYYLNGKEVQPGQNDRGAGREAVLEQRKAREQK